MPGFELIDAAIGLIFLYLLISLIATVVTEFVETFLKKRSANLWMGLKEMLNDPDGTQIVMKLYEHPMIFPMYQGGYRPNGKNLPSYIPSVRFAAALLDIVAPDGQARSLDEIKQAVENLPDTRLKGALKPIVNKAGTDIERINADIASWYDDTMDRVSGWYKRHTQIATLILGFLIAVAFNADTIGISSGLARDRAMREAFVAVAQGYAEQQPSGNSAKDFGAFLDEVRSKSPDIGLPIGWNPRTTPAGSDILGWLSKLLGFAFTAAAASLGASFWFDALKKLINIRNTLKPPASRKQQE
ncbi:MAG: hypothetical protein ACRESZ_11880 [Methylococcales bacterium]